MKDNKTKRLVSLLTPLAAVVCLCCLSVSVIADNALPIAQFSARAVTGFGGYGTKSSSPEDSSNPHAAVSSGEEEPPSSAEEPESTVTPPREVSNQPSSSAAPKAGKSSSSTVKVVEQTYGKGKFNYQNISLNNRNQNHTVDIAEELKKQPDVKIKKNGKPQVLIMHTHTSEAYADKFTGNYDATFDPRNQTETQNVLELGNIIEEALKKAGIGVIHDKSYHDYPEYTGAYSRAKKTIEKNLKENPSIQVVLDVHRDSISQTNGNRIKPTVTINNKKAAQIMILTGCDDEGKLGFTDWELNMRFAVRLQKSMADTYPGLARPISFAPRQYNMNLTHGSLLLEFGTDVNTLEEATYSAKLFAACLVKTLGKLT